MLGRLPRVLPARRAARLPMAAAPDATAHWARVWADHAVPPFDAGASSPALADLVRRDPALVAGRSVLVPGCGRGYDVATFVKAGAASAVGWDAVPAAVDAARAWLGSPAARLTADEGGRATVACADFFEEAGNDGARAAPSFDCAFDYTFCCALPPAQRPAWAAAYKALLRSPGATLITLMFPVETTDEARAKQGPPWPITPDDYAALLGDAFVADSVAPIPAALSHRGRGGREWLGVWRRVGEEGSKL